MMPARWTSALLISMFAVAAIADPVATTPVDPNLQRAQTAMAELGQTLRTALQEKIANDGVVAAVTFTIGKQQTQ